MKQFRIRCDDLWRLLLNIIAVREETAVVTLESEALTFKFGWFDQKVALTEIESVKPIPWPFFYGVGLRLGPKRTIGLIGSTQEVVAIQLRETKTMRLPFKLRIGRIAVSLEGHLSFVDELQARLVALKSAPR